MDGREADRILDSFRIVIDTREQMTAKAKKRFAELEPYERATLSYGDYCGNVDIDGKAVHDVSARISPTCAIERKMNLDELAMCFTRNRDRFEREFQRATEAGAKIYLLVENGSYEDIIFHRYRSRFAATAFLASLVTWSVRYNLTVVFCKANTSAKLILEILRRDMRERLVGDEFK